MKTLPKLFQIVELTRSQPQYGYALSGIKKNDLSSLAEHHYLVTFIAWQLAAHLNKLGAKLDVKKVLEFCLVHDLGEIFGGDIAFPYARVNKKAKSLAKAFEEENQNFLAKYFGNTATEYKNLTLEIMDAKTDEGLVAKVADYVECFEYKKYINCLNANDYMITKEKLGSYIAKMKNPLVKKELSKFVDEWLKYVKNNPHGSTIFG
ncbi:MAG TPA: HD domain-containing protein [Coxiellaceae bacterium]|nr:HD domain-containing protein [Coxiellaceae bacterium]